MRLILDTNILISAFIFPGGAPETVYRALLDPAAIARTVAGCSSPPN